MPVEIKFCVNIDRSTCVDESEIDTNFDLYRVKLLANESLYGAVMINSPGKPDIRVKDELEAIIQNICFLSIPKLVAGKPAVVPYFRYHSDLRLDIKGNEIFISGEFVPAAGIESRELIIALYNCGQRFIKFLYQLRGNDPDYKEAIEYLEKQAEVARHALEAA